MSVCSDLLFKVVAERKTHYFSKLKAKWFKDDDDRELFNFISNFFKQYKQLPNISTLEDTFDFIPELPEPLEYYVDKFSKFVYKLTVKEAEYEINKLGSEEGKEFELASLFGKLYKEANEIQAITSVDVKNILELGEIVLDYLKDRRETGIGITTGWETLDNATGGLQNGNIFVILARVKLGKSMIILYMANAAYNAGKKVMFISMEMTGREMGLRLLALRKHLNMTVLAKKEASTFTDFAIQKELEELSDNFLFVDGQFKKNISNIVGTIQTYQPDVVYIDGAYLIKGASKSNRSKWELIAEVIEELKSCAMLMDIPIVVSYQFNRDITRTTKSVKDRAFEKIGLSDAISQIASTGIAILQHETLENARLIEIIGGRQGEEGDFEINWNWEVMDFTEIKY